MSLKGDAKFKGKLTRGLKNDIRNLLDVHESSRKSGSLHFDGLFLPKAYKDLDEKVKLCLMALKIDAKLEEKLTLGSKNNMTNFMIFNESRGKSENLHFDALLLLIARKVSGKKVQKNYLS